MNSSVWWFGCKTEEDVAWYRRHINKPQSTLDWLQDQKGCVYQKHDVEDRDTSKELNTDILGPLFKNISALDQKILRMRHSECMKWQEISDELGYNLSYLWKREKRAMEKLRAIIDRDDLSPWRGND